MGALLFDSSNDRLRWTGTTASVERLENGAYTIGGLIRRNETGVFNAVQYFIDTTTATMLGFSFDSGNHILMDVAGDSPVSTETFTSTTSTILFLISKPSGTNTARLHWKVGSAGSWTHSNMSPTRGNGTTVSDIFEVGAWKATSDFFGGHIGLVFGIAANLSDANCEACGTNWRTSDIWNNAGGTPVYLFEMNVAPASLADLAGNISTLTAESGGNYPTLDSGETLDSWNFNGTGAGGSNTDRTTVVGALALTGVAPSRVVGIVKTPATP